MNDNILKLAGRRINEEIVADLKCSEESLAGTHIERWVRIDFKNKQGDTSTIYITNAIWFRRNNIWQ